jgi:hypothetical protein
LVLSLQGRYAEAKQIASQDISPEKAAENTETLRRIVKLEPKAAPIPEPVKALAQWTTDVEVSAAKPVETVPAPHDLNSIASRSLSHETRAVATETGNTPSWEPQIALSAAE